jgi:hypothetical protein
LQLQINPIAVETAKINNPKIFPKIRAIKDIKPIMQRQRSL